MQKAHGGKYFSQFASAPPTSGFNQEPKPPPNPGERKAAAPSNQFLSIMPMAASSRLLWASRAAAYLRISTFPRAFSTVLKDLKYADTHEWAKVEDDSATVGITDHAQDHLGDVVYVELPEVGSSVSQGKNFGAVESVKATSDINSPVSGEVVAVNDKLSEEPGLVNASPYEKGWIIKVKLSDSGELNSLMDDEKYSKFCEEENKH
ncbi:glycine cleavage system H protein 2, mitochondrial-like [Phragmites australis]|uniref:glycine cleavage system H protein 2, mitochondrial-like n=1 Tax=Phragmites australis TaxID=29695 RepID=UPI002D770908|nr:glycine cleavage system H protein 2, mitochondrial-like [Phragmites australis]